MAVLQSLTFGAFNHLPAGPTPLIFAVLAQYHAAIPTVYKYRIMTSDIPRSPSGSQASSGLVLSDKSLVYLLAGQLALSSLPGSAVAATVGWTAGLAWRDEWGPGAWSRLRIPAWIVGEKKVDRGGEFEGLRRRMGGAGSTTGIDGNRHSGPRYRSIDSTTIDQNRILS